MWTQRPAPRIAVQRRVAENGNDNAMSPLAGFANDGLLNALDVGNLMIVGEVSGDVASEFMLNLYNGVPRTIHAPSKRKPASTTSPQLHQLRLLHSVVNEGELERWKTGGGR